MPQVPTCAVDIYSFAMVMTYMLTGDIENYGIYIFLVIFFFFIDLRV